MPSLPTDLDKSGSPYNWLKTWIGPSIGWKMLPENLPQVYDILDFGGVGDNATDNSAAFAAAAAAMKAAGGGIIFFPPGVFRCSQPIVFNHCDGMGIIGSGRAFGTNKGTVLRYTGTSGDFISVTSSNGFRIESLRIDSVNIKTSGYDITISGCGRTRLSELLLVEGYSGIHLTGNNGTYLDHIDITFILGPSGIYQDNDVIVLAQNLILSTGPSFGITSVKTWTTNTPFVQGDIVITNGNAYQCSQSGTSANAGTGPSGVTGASADAVFSTPIQDGTAQWIFFCNGTLAWYRFGNGSQTCTIMNSEFLWGVYGLRSEDTNSNFLFLFDLETESSLINGVRLAGGGSFEASSCWFNGSFGSGVVIDAIYAGTVMIGQSQMSNHSQVGLDIHGPDVFIDDCFIKQNGTRNVYIGSAGVNVANSKVTNSVDGIVIDTTATNVYVAGNDVTNNSNKGVNDTSAATNIVVRDNRGWNPVGASTISTSASPFSYRAGHSPETVYLSASTSITALTVNGNSILPSGTGANVNLTVQLEPNELAVITYTGSLTAKKMIH